MRLHRLEIAAFGPFAEPAYVDFDPLNDAGLFLLAGATGAGKSSVLDAVCFALYGEVPGERNTAKRLRSDHAAPGREPRVALELTLRGRRFRVVRSPAWERPKKRGTGTTVQQAAVTLSERVDGQWRLLTTRLDEAGHEIGHLLGLTRDQFCQVVLLPQGRFQAFLRAGSEDRQRLLQQLFRTRRFEDVERWLRDHRLAVRQASLGHQRRVAELVSRVSEATETPPPASWEPADLTGPADADEIGRWVTELTGGLRVRVTDLDAQVAAATGLQDQARRALDAARSLADLQARRAGQLAELATLRRAAGEVDAARAALDRARLAAPLAPLLQAAGEADAALRVAEGSMAALPVDPATLDEAEQANRAAAARVEAALPWEAELQRARDELTDHTDQVSRLTASESALSEALAVLPAEIDRLQGVAGDALRADSESRRLREAVAGLSGRREAARVLDGVRRDLAQARADLAAAKQQALACKEAWLQVLEARVLGMAAELAGGLAAGAGCPVCGSAEHPAPARPAPGAPDAAGEKAARARVDDAEVAALAHEGRVRDLETRAAALAQQAGPDPEPEVAARLAAAEADLAAATERADRAEAARIALAQAEEEHRRLQQRLQQTRLHLARARAAAESAQTLADRLTAQVSQVLAGTGEATLGACAQALAAAWASLAEARTAVARLERAESAAAEAHRALSAAAAAAGFPDAACAAAALLAPTDLDGLARLVTEHDDRLRAVRTALDDPESLAAAATDPPDLPTLTAEHAEAEDRLCGLRTQRDVAASRLDRLGRLGRDLAQALRDWTPVRRDLALATRLACFAEGKSADNRLQTRLSAWVLGYRLGQVVAAANLRLGRMSDQRYTLEHTARRGAGENRGGLSLLVRDHWSGETRDPATLSGGETFVASLALALGLADVVTAEAGGAGLDTLFVDEGFGSLDADTLDDVLDVLDTLRDGGRVVGVVSHVAEMRDRISARLQVDKHRHGSSVRLVAG